VTAKAETKLDDAVPEDDVEMGFFDHLGELRFRLIRSIYGVVPGLAVGWIFREELLGALIEPFRLGWESVGMDGDPHLVFLNPIDPFVAYLKIAVIIGVLTGGPWLFWQLWAFISPGLYRKEKRLAIPFVVVATAFFMAGLSFGYFVVFPLAFEYFLEFAVILPGGVTLEPEIAISEILTFEMRMLLAFGIVFELPVVVSFMAAANIVHWKQLLKFSRWWVLISTVLASLLTPPDVGSQLLMLGPLIILWFVSVLFAFFIQRGRKEPLEKKKRAEAEEDD
jgi:sec-independent protein translocase protein TatC